MTMSPQQASDAARRSRSQTPVFRQRTKRLQEGLGGPLRFGISDQGDPVRKRHRMPFRNPTILDPRHAARRVRQKR